MTCLSHSFNHSKIDLLVFIFFSPFWLMRIRTGSFLRQYKWWITSQFSRWKDFLPGQKNCWKISEVSCCFKISTRRTWPSIIKNRHILLYARISFSIFPSFFSRIIATGKTWHKSKLQWSLRLPKNFFFSCYVLQFKSTPSKLKMLYFPESKPRLQLQFHSLHLSPSYILRNIFCCCCQPSRSFTFKERVLFLTDLTTSASR